MTYQIDSPSPESCTQKAKIFWKKKTSSFLDLIKENKLIWAFASKMTWEFYRFDTHARLSRK